MRTRRRTFGLITALFIAVALLAGANMALAAGRSDDAAPGGPFIGEPYGWTQFADDDHNNNGNNNSDQDNNNNNNNDDNNEHNNSDGGSASFEMRLVRVSDVNGGTGGGDFSANNPGTDSLEQGQVRHSDDNGVHVHLQGAQPSSTYDVQFEHLQDQKRDDLGNINTNSNGNFNGTTPNGLGSNRVGVIVLIRNGQDQFVSAL
jgi:hypothetical protein